MRTGEGPEKVSAQGTRWRITELVREGARNALARPVVLLVQVLAMFVLVGIVTVADLRVTTELLKEAEARWAEGAAVYVVDVRPEFEQEQLGASQCESLNVHSSVRHAGGYARGAIVRIPVDPRGLYQSIVATPRAPYTWGVRAPARSFSGVLLGVDAASMLGRSTGGYLEDVNEHLTRIDTVIPARSRNPEVVRAVVSVDSALTSVDQCWIEFRETSLTQANELLDYWYAGRPGIRTTPLLGDGAGTEDLAERYSSRETRHAWLVIVVAVSAISAASIRAGQPERALYRAIGTSRAQTLVMKAVEVLPSLAAGSTGGALAGWAFHVFSIGSRLTTGQTMSVLQTTSAIVAGSLVGYLTLTILTTRGSVFRQLKDL